MYQYMMDALERNPITMDTVNGFAYHNMIMYHQVAREQMESLYNWPTGGEMHDLVRASRELLIEVYSQEPDVVLFIDGSKYPPALFYELKRFIKRLNLKTIVAGYLTEAPYIDEPISTYDSFFDVLFTNDYGDYKKRNPNEDKAVYYLPHSYSEDIHYPVTEKQPELDVFFCGTVFPERSKILSGVNWTGINALLVGAWGLAPKEDYDVLNDMGIARNEILANADVAEYYRKSKIVINMGRTFGWDKDFNERPVDALEVFSMGPRVVEAAACGAFLMSEWRPEIEQVYGNAVQFYSSAGELEYLIRYYLDNESERLAKAKMAQEITLNMSYDDRLQDILIPAFQDAIKVIGQRQ
jgi:spore maturation protein CgeB